MLHFMVPSSHFFLSIRYFFINLTAIIKMVMSKVLTRKLLHPHMLCQPLFRIVCFVALFTIRLQIIHSQSENINIRNYDCIPQFFSIFIILSRFSSAVQFSTDSLLVTLIFTASSEVSPISTATLAAAQLSLLLSLGFERDEDNVLFY